MSLGSACQICSVVERYFRCEHSFEQNPKPIATEGWQLWPTKIEFGANPRDMISEGTARMESNPIAEILPLKQAMRATAPGEIEPFRGEDACQDLFIPLGFRDIEKDLVQRS